MKVQTESETLFKFTLQNLYNKQSGGESSDGETLMGIKSEPKEGDSLHIYYKNAIMIM